MGIIMSLIPQHRFNQRRAVALDMESATIAAKGFRFRFRVPYGTLLCISDKPPHGESLLPRAGGPTAQPQAAQLCGSGVSVDTLKQ
jgi:hypothetical protein